MSDLVGNPEDRFSRVAAQVCMTNMSRVVDTEVAEWAEGFRDNVVRVRNMILGR